MPKLVSIAGPLCGGVFPLGEGEGTTFSIGRAVNNSLCVEDPSVSRNHCVVQRSGNQYLITDRGSVNRTYINGLPLEKHTLRNGDEIKVGESLFLFLTEGDADAEAEDATLPDQRIHLASTLVVRMPESLQLAPRPESISVSLAGSKYFEALLSIGEAIRSTRSLPALERELLEPLCRALRAEHGTLILAAQGTGEPSAVYQWTDPQVSSKAADPAAMILERMIREPRAILWNRCSRQGLDFPANGLDGEIAPAIQSLAAVPLVAFEEFLGALCLTTGNASLPFDEQQLRFLTKSSGILAGLLHHAVHMRDQETEARQRQAEINLEHNMVGESAQMRRVYDTIAKVAPTDSTVLIRGESGTGKELAARAIHRNSRRSRNPFVAINCAALTETLLESELFGHEKGAFTGAVAQKRGKLEEAIGGTIFFDEVSEMSPVLQAKLLRVLQEREFERVGGTRSIKADVRVIAATNRDLDEAIRRGAFRSDLYFRLAVITLTLPPLRERRDDIEPLANHFAQKHSRKLKRRIVGISRQAYAHLRHYDWPGNVRELENVIERALVLGTTDMIQPEDLPDSVIESDYSGAGAISGASSFHATITEAKKRLIAETLQKTNGNYSEAAKLLELHPNSLHRIIRNLGSKTKTAD